MVKLENINLDRAMLGMSEAVAARMRVNVPVDTGRLRRSIKVNPLIETPEGITAPISFLEYGIYTDRGTKFIPAQHWVDRSIDEVIDQQLEAVSQASAQDSADNLANIYKESFPNAKVTQS